MKKDRKLIEIKGKNKIKILTAELIFSKQIIN